MGNFLGKRFTTDSFTNFDETKEGGAQRVITHLVYFITLDQGDQRDPLKGDWDQALFEPLLKVPISIEEDEFFEKAREFCAGMIDEEDVEGWQESQSLLLQLLLSGNIMAFEPLISVPPLMVPFREQQMALPKE